MTATTGKRIVLSTFGSFGDIHPYIAIALELKARGHTPVMATAEVYREKMDAAGLEFRPIRPDMPSYEDEEALVKLSEELIDPYVGTEKVMKLFTANPREVYDDLDQAVEGADLLLTHPLPLVGPIVAQKRGLPWVSSVLAPISLFSAYDPPVPPQFPPLYHLVSLSPVLGRLFYRIARHHLEKPMEPIYRLRAELGLPRGEQPFLAGQHSPTRVLALFSPVLANPQPDWPINTLITGFPFYDRRDYFNESESPAALVEFLEAGPPPIVFTLGSSAFWVAEDFYRDSIRAAQELGQRALLLIGHARNQPKEPLPADMAAFEYAPFGEVLPRASVIVHQGGVGTTGQGLRSGRPTLIVPHAHDQFDNAARVAKLGCGRTIARPRYNARTAIKELRKLLENPTYQNRAAEIGSQVQLENGTAAAVDAIEEVLAAG
ncbi:MAG TPA: nucleotide disphospho-sugar-binding domain-containing protein [Pyrinomonadaceae bacterium]|nr:nucleotide disphospho-sugar-binding domain-containing protein [Pyrinomonadaceae bacterium]